MKVQGNLQVTGDGEKPTVQEIDGNPTVLNVDVFKFTNGSVTDNGDGSVTIAVGGGAGGISAVDDGTSTYSSQTAMGFSGDSFYLSRGTTGKPVLNLRASAGGVTAHSALTGLVAPADDHTQYSLVTGARAYTGTIGGITPVATSDLATKGYVDTNLGPGFYGIVWSDGLVTKRTDRLSFSNGDFYIEGQKPTLNIKSNFLRKDGTIVADSLHIGFNDVMVLAGSTITESLGVNSNTQTIIELDTANDTPAIGSLLYASRSRGTIANKTTVADGDSIGSLWGLGHDGTDFAVATNIQFKVDGPVSDNKVPGKIDFSVTAPNAVAPSTPAMTIRSDSSVVMQNTLRVNNQITAEAFYITSLGELVNVHGQLTGLSNDDHPQYSLVTGARAFTGTVGGITPVASTDLTTKGYVDGRDILIGPAFYGVFIRESRAGSTTYRNDTLIFDSGTFYINPTSVGKPMVSLRGVPGLTVQEIDGSPFVQNVTNIQFTNGAVTDNGGGSATINLSAGSGISTLTVGSQSYASQTTLGFNSNEFYLSPGGGANQHVVNLVTAVKKYIHRQTVGAIEWTVNHNLATLDVIYNLYDTRNRQITPNEAIMGFNSSSFYFITSRTGRIVLLGV